MTAFVPGLELARALYDEVGPVLADHGLAHTAALVGAGSDVLGLDDATSTDHDRGPRLQVLLSPADHAGVVARRLAESVTDPEVRLLTQRPLVRGIDLLIASTDLAVDLDRTEAVRQFY